MKVLSAHDSKPEDTLLLTLDAAYTSSAALQNTLEPFLLGLERSAAGLMPDVVKGRRQRRYSRASFWKALAEVDEQRGGDSTGLGFYRTEWPALDMSLGLWHPPQPPQLDIHLRVKPLSFFTDEQRCVHFIELVHAWAAHYRVTHAVAHSGADMELAGHPDFGRDKKVWHRDGFDKIYDVCWLNVFGPQLVESVGRERMLSTPAHRVEALPNGSVLLVTWPKAADFASEEARLAHAPAHVHLPPDLDFETVLRALRERSATLAPVEPRFPPDLSALLSRVVDTSPLTERQHRMTELNAWRPPAPTEWLSADEALPSDGVDPERALEHYSLQAERLVAMLHTEVPSLFEGTPESLTDADFYFWRDDSPRRRERELLDVHVLPAVGAYLGQVLVRHLGGRWIPRRPPLETGVLVGNRVWLPFLRAQNYLRSRQSLLDCSLTQLFREAERHCASSIPSK